MDQWEELIKKEKNKPYHQKLDEFLIKSYNTKTIYPPKEKIYECFSLTPLDKVKAVIIGQDPYYNQNQAHGLAFSVKTKKIPPSLKNIFKELKTDLNIDVNQTGDLTPWAKQGVLLLNTILTVEEKKPLSHKNMGWETFTEEVIKELNKIDRPLVYILWGNQAKAYQRLLNNPNHLIITSPHPSPLSAYHGFFNSKPFSKTNEYLETKKVKPIDWSL